MSQTAPFSTNNQILKHTELSELDSRFLRWIYELHYTTIPQIVRLQHQTITSSRFKEVAARLKTLDEQHKNYVQRGFLARAIQCSRNPSVFRLATRGISHMAKLGLLPLPKFQLSDPFPSAERLQHTLYINDVIIAAKQLVSRTQSGLNLWEFRHDWILKTAPVPLETTRTNGKGKDAIIADVWFDFRLPINQNGTSRYLRLPVHFELDCGTETNVLSVTERLKKLLVYINGPYEAYFHTPHITLAFATTKGLARALKLRELIEAVLHETRQEQVSHLFYCTALPHTSNPRTGKETDELNIDPRRLFLEPVWLTPFDDSLKILLDASIPPANS